MTGWVAAKCSDGFCAEVKIEGTSVYVRSSRSNQLVTFTVEEWNAFKESIKRGHFDV